MLAALAFIMLTLRPNTTTRSLARGRTPVPSSWQATPLDSTSATTS
jgi:hypothetical protein